MKTLFQKNINLYPPEKLSPWRKISIGSWRITSDSSIHGMIELDAEPAIEFIRSREKLTGKRITITHLAGLALSESLKRNPKINSVIRFGNIYRRKNVDLFFHVANDPSGEDLTGVTIRQCESKTLDEIADELTDGIWSIRNKTDMRFSDIKKIFGFIPAFFSRIILNISSFIMYSLNIWSPVLKAPKDAFGSAMVTNVGSLGLRMGFVPIAKYTRIPLILCIGEVHVKPVVKDGEIKIGKVIHACFTFDHRIIDGVYFSYVAKCFTESFLDPENLSATRNKKFGSKADQLTQKLSEIGKIVSGDREPYEIFS